MPLAPVVSALRAEVAALDQSPRALRSFGLVVGGVLGLIGGGLAWRAGWDASAVSRALLGVGGALVVLGALVPRVLRPVHTGWMALALVLGLVMTRVVLTLVFALVFVPVGLALRLAGRDLLHRRPDAAAPTYWTARDDGGPDRDRLERYY